jgi:hypothetical protein
MTSVNKAKAVLGATVLLTLAAGTGLGMMLFQLQQSQTVSTTPPQPQPKRSWLADKLGLSADQQKQMDEIWESTRSGRRHQDENRRAATSQRDQEIASLLATLSPDQRSAFETIRKNHAARLADLAAQDRKAYDDAVESTRKMLTAEQVATYDELMKNPRRRGMGGPGGFGGPGGPIGPGGPGGQHRFHRGSGSRPDDDRTGRPGTLSPTTLP